MTTQNLYDGIRHVVRVTTESSRASCEHCHHEQGGLDFPASINHYIEQHGYRLLHVGTETTDDKNGNPWHCTIAVLGKETGNLDRIDPPSAGMRGKPGQVPK
jgi:hypothetical protein